MPEGDTVWLAARRLHTALAGEVLTTTDFRVPQLATADLSGRRVEAVVSRGKHLLARVGGGVTLHTHFRMDGTWHLYRSGERWRGGPAWQVRAVLTTAAWQAVGYRLPVVELLPTAEEHRAVGHLGPDLLGADWHPAEALRRLRADPDRDVGSAPLDQRVAAGTGYPAAPGRSHGSPAWSIGEALLDQTIAAGIGTLYRAETLFLQGLHPRTPVADVEDPGAVYETARRLLLANRDRPEQISTGDPRRGRQHWVYGRAGQPCRRCGSSILREEYGPRGRERLSYWCPRCQRRPDGGTARGGCSSA